MPSRTMWAASFTRPTVHALKYCLGNGVPVLRQDCRRKRMQSRRVALQFYGRRRPGSREAWFASGQSS